MTTKTKVLIALGVVGVGAAIYFARRKEQDGRVAFSQFNASECQCWEVLYDAAAKPIRSEKRTKAQCLDADPDLAVEFENCP